MNRHRPRVHTGVPVARRAHAFIAAEASGLIALPAWLTITCATTNRTSQQSATTVQKGYAANAARARNVGSGFGLSVECASTNRDRFSEAVGSWTMSGSATASDANGQTAPDGTLTADKLNWIAGADSLGSGLLTAVTNGTRACCSVWALQDGSTTQIQSYDSNSAVWNDTFTLTSSWQRISSKGTAGASNTLNRWGRHGVIAAGAAWLWGTQLEDKGYPTSYIVSAAGGVARAGDVLVAAPAVALPSGFFRLDMTFAPNYADTEFGSDHNLFYVDANNRIYLKQSDKKVYIVVGGQATASSALTFSREDAIRIVASHTPSAGQSLAVYKNAVQVGSTVTDSTVKTAISAPSSVGILCDTTAAVECADLRSLAVGRA